MPTLTTTGDKPITLHYTDSGGEGRPVVLIHGWPLSGEAFAGNRQALVDAGHRVITYDRRGFGRSDKPTSGYEYDTLAADLNDLITQLDLRQAVILGFSMGGGEVARYCSTYGTDRLAGAVLSGSICPALCIRDDNPDGGMPMSGFEGMADSCAHDKNGFLDQFITWFFSNNEGLTVDEATRRAALRIALQCDQDAAVACILAWATDLREDCKAIDVPLLAIHGDGDQNVPLAKSTARITEFVPNAQIHVIEGGPHGANVSHQAEWEGALLRFLTTLD